MDDRSEGSLIEMDHARRQKQRISIESIDKPLRRRVTIDILPDDVLLIIFHYYVGHNVAKDRKREEWQMLVHVCQNWRYVVFLSPLRLNLRILCSAETPVREKLALWPPLPIIIEQYRPSTSKYGEDNIIAALGHNNRVCEIGLTISGSLLERVFAAMQKKFVALKYLKLNAIDDRAPAVSDSFLGGSAPHLRHLLLTSIPLLFPVLQKLLLSAPNLIELFLHQVPHSAYFSPEEMITCLSALTRLETLWIGLDSTWSHPSWEGRHLPLTHLILPALTDLTFIGVCEYLEGLVTRIDAPLLDNLNITFFNQLVFDNPQLVQFISRTPKFKAYDEARVIFANFRATIALSGIDNQGLQLSISCGSPERQLSSLAQVCTSSFPRALISNLKHLNILEEDFPQPLWRGDLEDNRWSELFHPFTTVKNLYLSQEIVPRIMPTLQELVGERVTEVLPDLQSIFLRDFRESEFVAEAMRQLTAARQLSSRPIAISRWNGWSTIDR